MKRFISTISILWLIILFSPLGAFGQHAEYSGQGDDVISLDKPDSNLPALLVISGNRSERHFSITGYDGAGQRTDLLVNTTDSYSGKVPVDLGASQTTTRLEISAQGSWRIHVYQIGAAPSVSVPGSYEGSGDDVLWVSGEPSVVRFVGNQGKRHFSAIAYDKFGNRLKLLVNTTDSYDGRTIAPSQTQLLEVQAAGDWLVEIE